MNIRRTTISPENLISDYLPSDYADAFECTFTCEEKITADDVMIAFWTHSPEWIDKLFKLRDVLVKPLGIQPGSDRSREKLEEAVRTGGNYGFVNVVAKSDTETVISANDKHLVMYFSIKVNEQGKQKEVTVSTLVRFHNWLGCAYFYVIYPFHQFIVPSMIKHALRKLIVH